MLTTALILSLLTLSGVDAACSCYTTASQVTGAKQSLSNGFDSNDFSTCYPGGDGCGFIAYSGSPSIGWTSITVTFTTPINDQSGKFIIYDGKDSNANQILTFTVTDSGLKPLTSSTPYIYVKYTQTNASAPNAYFGMIIAESGFAPPTTTATSTLAPTTTPYTNTNFAKNPHLISHDILILVNQKTNQGMDGLNALNSLAGQFANLLSITPSNISESQSRLGLATITPYAPFYAAQGEIWSMTATDVNGALPKSGVSIAPEITTALTNVLLPFFTVGDAKAGTRKNVQRSVILFTAWWDDAQSLDAVRAKYLEYGVNLAIVGFNTKSDQLTNSMWYNYVSLTNTTEVDVAKFVNAFYLNSNPKNELANNWCKKGADPIKGETVYIIKEPSDYTGPSESNKPWDSFPTNGERARYCNFQDTTYTYTRQKASNLVVITVFYELEVEQDYLKFFADGVEIESFTGLDVNTALFKVNATVITARFTTDSSGVKRGFTATFNEVLPGP